MSAIPKQEYIEYYRECEEKRYRDFLDSLSDSISFDSDKWICEKRFKKQSQLLSKVTIYFSMVQLKEICRRHDIRDENGEEYEQLAYFKEQAADWESKAEKFRCDRQLQIILR